ncbi:MAG: type II toxin-antitoxin system RelE/ParE family toxin [Clostridiales bacterium]|jgi:plasmid stabilization system protein ParE|nr:type II toxin-antitoxin system RelE/ParE family toxin [Clostridiales bacterium]
MKKFEISSLVGEDLYEIFLYFAGILALNTYDELYAEIQKKYENLKLFPESGIPVKIKKYNRYRWILIDKYYIFYTNQNDTVTIQRIIHTARNFKKLLEENL